MKFNASLNYRPIAIALAAFLAMAAPIINDDSVFAKPTQGDASANVLMNDPEAVAAFLDSLFQKKMKELHVPGAVFVLVRDGGIFFSKGYGYADLEKQIPVDPDRTLFRIASVSKVVTGAAVMQLAGRGLLDMNKDVNEYLTRFKLDNNFKQPVTMAHLLTHTGGFDDNYIGKVGRTPEEQAPLGEFLAERMPKRVMTPGEVYSYSNHSNALAGYLVEAIAKKDFAEYAEENIFRPLEMNHSSFRLPEHLAPDLSKGYIFENGKFREFPFDYLNSIDDDYYIAFRQDEEGRITHLFASRLHPSSAPKSCKCPPSCRAGYLRD